MIPYIERKIIAQRLKNNIICLLNLKIFFIYIDSFFTIVYNNISTQGVSGGVTSRVLTYQINKSVKLLILKINSVTVPSNSMILSKSLLSCSTNLMSFFILSFNLITSLIFDYIIPRNTVEVKFFFEKNIKIL